MGPKYLMGEKGSKNCCCGPLFEDGDGQATIGQLKEAEGDIPDVGTTQCSQPSRADCRALASVLDIHCMIGL